MTPPAYIIIKGGIIMNKKDKKLIKAIMISVTSISMMGGIVIGMTFMYVLNNCIMY